MRPSHHIDVTVSLPELKGLREEALQLLALSIKIRVAITVATAAIAAPLFDDCPMELGLVAEDV